jgi:hypothetical protein
MTENQTFNAMPIYEANRRADVAGAMQLLEKHYPGAQLVRKATYMVYQDHGEGRNKYIVILEHDGGMSGGYTHFNAVTGRIGHTKVWRTPSQSVGEYKHKKMNRTREPYVIFSAETFEAPYGGAGALMDIGKSTDLSDFDPSELTESSAIHGDFDQASLNYSGHQNLEVRAEGTGRPYWIKKVRFQGNSEIANEKGGNPFHPTEGIFSSAAAANRDLQKMLEIAKNLPDIRIYIENEHYSDYQQPIADASYRWRVLHEGTTQRTTHHGFSLYLPYGHYSIGYEAINKLGAEMDIVADGMAVVSNKGQDIVGVVEAVDDEDDDEMVELSIQDENMKEIGSFTLDDGQLMDDSICPSCEEGVRSYSDFCMDCDDCLDCCGCGYCDNCESKIVAEKIKNGSCPSCDKAFDSELYLSAEGMDFTEAAKTGYGIGAGLTLWSLTLGVGAVLLGGAIAMFLDNKE